MRRPEPFSFGALERILFGELCLPRQSRFVVAFSGGADSSALLHALARIPEAASRARAIHIHHGLHLLANDWAHHCIVTCAGLGIPCVVRRIEARAAPDLGPEGSARAARYQALREMLAESEVLLTAHHESDQAETVLLQLFRGCAVPGLAAIPRSQPFGRGQLVRPLLEIPGAALRDYLQHHQVAWIEDPSNSDCGLRRNYLRHRIMPLLEAQWPQPATALARAARRARAALTVLTEIAKEDLSRALDPGQKALRIEALRNLSEPRLANLLHRWITQTGAAACSESQMRRLIAWLRREPGSPRISWSGLDIRRYRGLIYQLSSAPSNDFTPISWDLSAPLALPALGLALVPSPATGNGLARGRIPQVEVRLRSGGEVCRPHASRHQRPLKKILQDRGIPPWERARLPLLFVGSELAAVADLWVCAPFAAEANEPGVVVRVDSLA